MHTASDAGLEFTTTSINNNKKGLVMNESVYAPSAQAQAFLEKHHQCLIGDQWCDAADGQTIQVLNPATAEVIARVPRAGPARD